MLKIQLGLTMKISLLFAYFTFVHARPNCYDPRFVPTAMVMKTSLDSITIGWSTPPPGLQDRVHRYKVMATHLDETLGPVSLPRTANSYEFKNLSSESSYLIEVAVCTQYKTQCGDLSIVLEGFTLSPEGQTPDAIWLRIGVIIAVVLLVTIIWMCLRTTYKERACISVPVKNFEAMGPTSPDLDKIGRGKFGVTKTAEAQFIHQSKAVTTVAVKSVKDLTNPFQAMTTLDCEPKILAYHGEPLKVVSLLSACATNISYAHRPLVITEFRRFGNLRECLWNLRADFIDQINTVFGNIDARSSHCTDCVAANSISVDTANSGIGSVTEIVCSHRTDSTDGSMTLTPDQGVFNYRIDYGDDTRDLLIWAWQVAHAMKYLGSKGILHGDLAAITILLGDDKVVRICDFGSAKIPRTVKAAESKEQDFMLVPWSAIESIRDAVIPVRSDIWFYGLVLWEFFSLGEAPCDKKELETPYEELVDRFRLKQSRYSNQDIHSMIQHDRDSEPFQRPSFSEPAEHWSDDSSDDSYYVDSCELGIKAFVGDFRFREFSSSSSTTSDEESDDASKDFGSGDYIARGNHSILAEDYVPMRPAAQKPEGPYAEPKIGDPAKLLPYDETWEFPREQLILGERIGSGRFGNVKKAEARSICESEPITTVAVKSVVDITDPFQAMIIDCEIKILGYLGKHLNVVSLLGACNTNISYTDKPMMIMEYCRHGNLRDYLRNRRAYFISQVDTVTGKITAGSSRCTDVVAAASSSVDTMDSGISSVTEVVCTRSTDATNGSMTLASDQGVSDLQGDNGDENPEPIYTQDLLSWAWQVAHGMKYLSSKGILHGDLAARNILLADDKVVKICDFGLAKILHIDEHAENKKQDFIPLQWSSIESVRDRMLSARSDIWSYGIVLWEFFSLGEIPYGEKELEFLHEELVDGFRLEKPKYATQEIYRMMLHCWASEPCQRPTFNEIAKCIGNLLDDNVKTHYINLSALGVQPYVDALEDWERDFSLMKPPEEKFGGTSVQVDTDHSEDDGSGDYLTESQFDKELSGSNIQVNTDGSGQIGLGNYYAVTQFKEELNGANL